MSESDPADLVPFGIGLDVQREHVEIFCTSTQTRLSVPVAQLALLTACLQGLDLPSLRRESPCLDLPE